MNRPTAALVVVLSACGSHPAAMPPPKAPHVSAGASAACLTARATRTQAADLDKNGHAILALAKLDEANAACPAERATTAPLELTLLAENGLCAKVRALAPSPDARSAAAGATAACTALEAPSKGTAATARAKMHEADTAERAKDYARAKTLYLAAWAELHPSPRALESAARVAGLAGDPAESRRLRDRALLEAEATEHAVPKLTDRVRVTGGSAHLSGDVLTLGQGGKVVARDLRTGELRVLLDLHAPVTRLSRHGTLAFTANAVGVAGPVSVYDVLTGERLLHVTDIIEYAASPDDTLVVMRNVQGASANGRARVFDVATGRVVATATGAWRESASGDHTLFTPDDTHLLVLADDDQSVYRQWDLKKGGYTGPKLPSEYGVGAPSSNGRYFAYLETLADGAPLHVRDMVSGKDVAHWTGRFHSVSALAISPDGKTLATGSRSSLRLWDVARQKQIQKTATIADFDTSTDSTDASTFAFSDDGKTMVLAGNGLATGWDVATGAEKSLVTAQPPKKVLRVVPAPDGVAIVLEDEVRIVPTKGDPQTVCRGTKPRYFDLIGPTNVAFSPSGKSFACAMSDGWVHVFDTATWKERAVVKKGPAAKADRPVDLAFSADDATLTVVTDHGLVMYDAATAAKKGRVTFAHAGVGLAPRHARFDDGTVAVRTWKGGAAVFGADGAFQREVKLFAGAPIGALDAFAPDGKTYAVALGKKLHVVDLGTGDAREVDLPEAAKSLAVGRGGAIAVALKGGAVVTVTGGAATPLADAKGSRVWIAGRSILVAGAPDALDVYTPGAPTLTLEVDPDGLVARDATGAFDARGKPELECVVGKTFLSRETCADLAKDGLVAAWLARAK
jgi:WD40 repeat protein